MRKNLLLGIILGGTLLSCTREAWVEKPDAGQTELSEKTWTVTVNAVKGEGTVTKITLSDDGWEEEEVTTKGLALAEDNPNYLESTWDFKEKVYVYYGGTYVGELESQETEGGNIAYLSGTIDGNFTVGEVLELYLIGPQNERSYIGQKGTLEDITENYNYASAHVNIETINSQTESITLTPAKFKNLQSISEFSFGVVKVKSLTISGAGIVGRNERETHVTVTPDEPTNKLYVAISNKLTGQKIPYEFLMETDNGQVLTKTKKATLENGKFYKAGINSYSLYNAVEIPLTLEMLENDNGIIIRNPRSLTIKWKVNDSDYMDSADTLIQIEGLNIGDKVAFHSQNLTYGDTETDASPRTEKSTMIRVVKKAYVYGNITSLRDGFNFSSSSSHLLTVPDRAYAHLFLKNPDLYNHPYKDIVLPATKVGRNAYYGMFSACSNLTRASDLPATDIDTKSYQWMYLSCDNLRKAPAILPATSLADQCYRGMFQYCYNLEASPELPAEKNLANGCYMEMFYGCSNLKQITCYAKSPSNSYTSGWVYGVPSSGYFKKHPDASWITGVSGIPAGWGGQEPLTIEAIEAGTITINNPQRLRLRYSTAANLSMGDPVGDAVIEIPLNAGDKLRLWGDNDRYGGKDGNAYLNTTISGTAPHYVYGDIRSLVSSGAYTSVNSLSDYAFTGLFAGNTMLRSHDDLTLTLGAASVGEKACESMFSGCIGLRRAPELPATTLGNECYASMFNGCTDLTTAPSLPAKNLATGCYGGMFRGCILLVTAPALPATTLKESCYMNMFTGCTNLENAPALNASTLVSGCYSYMFRECSSLNAVTCLATNPVLSDYNVNPYVLGNVDGWLEGTASGGVLTRKAGVSWPRNAYPANWTLANN